METIRQAPSFAPAQWQGATLELAPQIPPSRAHLLVRVLLLLLCGAAGTVVSWPFGVLYLALPIVAAILISEHGSAGYLAEDSRPLVRVLGWCLGLWAYLALVTDHFPTGGPEPTVRFHVTASGRPSVGSAALRVLTSLPALLVAALLGVASGVVWLVSAVWVLVRERYPRVLHDFQCGVLRYLARLCAYHASLVDHYPPFTLERGPSEASPAASA